MLASVLGPILSAWVILAPCSFSILAGVPSLESGRGTRPLAVALPEFAPQTGGLRATVRMAGAAVPAPTRIENTTDPEICGRFHEVRDLLVSPDNRGVQNVIVALVVGPPSTGPEAPSGQAPTTSSGRPDERVPGESISSSPGLVIENRECEFVPRVAVLTVGSSMQVVSRDNTLHTVHLYGPVERNVALPNPSVSASVRIDRPGMITVLCDVHGWMRAFVRVDPDSFHAVTDEKGRAEIGDIPAGTYKLELWHERLGVLARSVRIVPGQTLDLEIPWSLEQP